MNSILEIFSSNLRKHRKKLHLTQKELAEQLSYSEKAVSKWETGLALPPSALLPKLAQILKTGIDDLMSYEGDVKYYLGIDGRSTKTEFILADSEGKILRRTILGPSNPNDVGISGTEDVLRRGIMETIAEYNTRSISAYAGISGAGVADFEELIRKFLGRLGFARVQVGSDGMNPISAGLMKEDGIVAIIGTGSSVYAKKGSEILRSGGYGHLLEDSASRFNLGRDAIVAALRAEDGCAPDTRLLPLLKMQCNTDKLNDALGIFYKGGKNEIAKYANVVYDAYREGDLAATEIIRRNICRFADLIKCVAASFDKERIPVILFGNMISMKDIIIPILEEYLSGGKFIFDISVCETPASYGALYLAGMKYPNSNIKDDTNA